MTNTRPQKLLVITSFALVTGFIVFQQSKLVSANHNSFDSTVESFEIVGNLPVSIVDEFDDGIVTGTITGTVSETGGTLLIESPGDHNSVLQALFPFTLNSSSLLLPTDYNVDMTGGSFVATSTWTQSNPALAEGDSLILFYPSSDTTAEVIAVSHSFLPTPIANLTGWDKNKIYSQTFLEVDITDPDNVSVISLTIETTPRSPNITGDVSLAFSYNDTSDELTSIISDDGGVTQFSPFSPIDASGSAGPGVWFLRSGRLEFP